VPKQTAQVLQILNPRNIIKYIPLPALCGALRYVVHEDISSGGSSPVTGHINDGTRDKLVTDQKEEAGNRHSHITKKRKEKTPQSTDLSLY